MAGWTVRFVFVLTEFYALYSYNVLIYCDMELYVRTRIDDCRLHSGWLAAQTNWQNLGHNMSPLLPAAVVTIRAAA